LDATEEDPPMSTQLSLWDAPPLDPVTQPQYIKHMTNPYKWLLYHKTNPHVAREIIRRARLLKRTGHKKIGIALIVEAMRYDYALKTADPSSQFKISNDYRAYYARYCMEITTDLPGFFKIKPQSPGNEYVSPIAIGQEVLSYV
jgi:hypothetical protein